MTTAVRSRRLRRDGADIDPDREDLRAHDTAEGTQDAAAEFLSTGPAQQVIAEAVEVRLGLEPDEIISTEPLCDVLVVRQHPKQFGRRKGGVQEKSGRL